MNRTSCAQCYPRRLQQPKEKPRPRMRIHSMASLKSLTLAHNGSSCLLHFAICLLVTTIVRRPLAIVRALWPKLARVSFCLLPFALCLLVCFSPSVAAPSPQTKDRLKVPPQEDPVLPAVVQLLAVGPASQ